ncbi:MAG: hypothetical protein RSF67_02685 [Clostridia bacterium]
MKILKTIAKAVSLFWISMGSLFVLLMTGLAVGFIGLIIYGMISTMI